MMKTPILRGLSLLGPALLAAASLVAPLSAAPEKGAFALSRARFPAKGRQEAVLEIARAGRYALAAKSKQGAQIQLVDRMTGPSGSDGESGQRDGRLDVLLDAGKYKVQIHSPEKGRGEVSLDVHAFAERRNSEPPLLVDRQPVEASLEDFQQDSWWVHIPERRTVYLEAQGRGLADLRLWKDGAWLLDREPQVRITETVKGRPERNCLLVVDLNPGTYLLTAYGGPALPWAKETGGHPFHLRSGLPVLPAVFRTDGRVSAFGLDRFLVPAGADLFFLQLAAKRNFRMEVGAFNLGDPLGVSQASASITKKSADPECSVRHVSSKTYSLVSLAGDPGEHYVLQVLDDKDTYALVPPAPKDYRIATLHSGYVDDNIDATGILVASGKKGARPEVIADDAIHLGAEKGWARRFNLLGENSAFFYVEEPGDYQILSSGTDAEFVMEPFFLQRPFNYASPTYSGSGSVFPLEKGYWKLTLRPRLKGVLRVALQKKGLLQRLADWVTGKDQASPLPGKPGCLFPKVRLDPERSYTLYLGHQEGVSRGATVQPLPLKLEEPLAMVLQPGRDESVLVAGETECRLTITAPAAAKFDCYVDGKPWVDTQPLAPGPHAVWVRNNGPKGLQCTLQGVQVRLASDAPPVFLPSAVKQSLEAKLPILTTGSPYFLDLGVQEQRTAVLTVPAPGFYRVETTGLLKTALTIRSAVRTKLFSAEANGVGRNALLSQYLKEGEYLLTVQTLGASAGHAGVKVARTEVTEAGDLLLDREAKAEILANRGIAYGFSVAAPGKYALRTTGQGRFFPCRLEDAEGWPVLSPGQPSDLSEELAPGRYRFLSLPVDVDTLRLTSIHQVPEKRHLEGKGPHPLALGEAVANRWMEPAPGSTRQRDVYTLAIPADLDVRVHLGNPMMQAFLVKAGGGEPPRTVRPGKDWAGLLPAGDYRLEVECSRINDRVDYDVKVATSQLAPGLRRAVAVPGWVEVRLAKDSVVEIYSQGQVDVRGLLHQALPDSPALVEMPPEPEPAPRAEPGAESQEAPADAAAAEAEEASPEPEPSEMEPSEGDAPEETEAPPPDAAEGSPERAPAPAPPPAPRLKTGPLVDANDDAYQDWNFRIARRLPAGRYLLRVEGVGGQTGTTTIGMDAPAEVVREALPSASDRALELGGSIALFPLTSSGDDGLLSVRVSGASLYGCILESMGPAGPVSLLTRTGRAIAFDLPTRKEGTYRLRLWSADHQSESVRLRTWNTTLPVVPLEKLEQVKVSGAAGDACKTARIRLARGGTFRPGLPDRFTYATSTEVPLGEAEDGLATLPEGDTIVRWGMEGHGPSQVSLTRVVLGLDRKPLKLRLSPGARPRVDAKGAPGEGMLVMAKAQTGKVACAPASGEGHPALSRAYAMVEGYALAVLPPGGSSQVQIWNPLEGSSEPSEFEVLARGFTSTPNQTSLSPGVAQLNIGAGQALTWALPAGGKQVDLVLEPGLAAYLSEGGRVAGVAFAPDQASQATFLSSGASLTVVNFGSAQATMAVTLRQRAQDTFVTTLPAEGPLEREETAAGSLRLDIPAAPGRSFSVAGTDVRCEWMDAEGVLHVGDRHDISQGGVAHLTFSPGLVKAWTWEKNQEAEGRWWGAESGAVSPLAPNSVMALEGPAKGFTFTVERPSALKVHWEGSAVARLSRGVPGQPPKLMSVTEGGSGHILEQFLEPGPYTLDLRALHGRSLGGTAEFSLSEVLPITRTFGPETLIRAGETRTFAFTLPKAGTVGIGLASDRDVLSCHLLKGEGTVLGTGIQQMETLPAGTYYLRIGLPQGEPPLKFSPVVVGLEAPASGPPEEVLREFLDQIGMGPQ